MQKKYFILGVLIIILIALLQWFPFGFFAGFLPSGTVSADDLSLITLPEGFKISIYASGVGNARSLTQSESGVLFVGTRTAGKVYAVRDLDQDFAADEVLTIASGLTMPNGVAFRDGDLYVAEVSRILRFRDIEEHLDALPEYEVISEVFPENTHHGWKFIAFGPDGKLYVPVGAPCNICDPGDPYAAITRMEPDGSDWEIYARGVRNTVGFDWHPLTEELWFTDNGRDLLGENIPPDELNHAPEIGMHFGYPFCHGKDVQDPEFDSRSCDEFIPPAQELGPHVASLGMEFYTGEMFPEKYRRGIFIAEHGSWNRKIPIGYRIVFVELDGDTPVSYEVFAEGWLHNGIAWGRPVDLEQMPDGSLLVSDDKGDVIYRISYTG